MKRKSLAKTDEKIKNEDDRYITFSKRKAGIFKKASELAALCNPEIGIVIFSPRDKPYSYGHPSIESIANRFQNRNPPTNNNPHALVEAQRRSKVNEELNEQVSELYERIDKEKERQGHLLKLTEGKLGKNWYDKPIDDLSFEELEKINDSLEKLYQNMGTQDNIPVQVTNPVAASSSLDIN